MNESKEPEDTLKCEKGCCSLLLSDFIPYPFNGKEDQKKAGFFIIDKSKEKVLLVQSRGQHWGIPKGTLKDGETYLDCALREVKEETGLDIKFSQIRSRPYIINNKAYYFYVDIPETPVTIQKSMENNDANGIGWIGIECLKEMVRKGIMSLNRHTKVLLANWL